MHEEAKAKETKWKRGERAACRWDDSSDKVCEILDIREYRDSAGEQKNEYYVHYVDFDRRLGASQLARSLARAQCSAVQRGSVLRGSVPVCSAPFLLADNSPVS